ncbi:MAG: hypothetical protein OXB88_06785 [Bacteriovoracales bacterium]|nr:hypothetical protein [Bacteriovoracales bacterium]
MMRHSIAIFFAATLTFAGIAKATTIEFDEFAGRYELRVNDLRSGEKHVEVRLNDRTIYSERTSDNDLDIPLPGDIVYCGETLKLYVNGYQVTSVRAVCEGNPSPTPTPVPVPTPAPPTPLPSAHVDFFSGRIEVEVDDISAPTTVKIFIGKEMVYKANSGNRTNLSMLMPRNIYYCHHSIAVYAGDDKILSRKIETIASDCLPPLELRIADVGRYLEIEMENLRERDRVTVYVGSEKVVQEHLDWRGTVRLPRPTASYYCHLQLEVYVGDELIRRRTMSGVSDQCTRRVLGRSKMLIPLEHLCGKGSYIEVYTHFESSGRRALKVSPGSCRSLELSTRTDEVFRLRSGVKKEIELTPKESKTLKCDAKGLKAYVERDGRGARSVSITEPIGWFTKNVTCRF